VNALVLEFSVSKHDMVHEKPRNPRQTLGEGMVREMNALEVEVHRDIHVQPPLRHSGANGWNTVTAGELSTVIGDGIPNIAIPNDQNTVKWVGEGPQGGQGRDPVGVKARRRGLILVHGEGLENPLTSKSVRFLPGNSRQHPSIRGRGYLGLRKRYLHGLRS